MRKLAIAAVALLLASACTNVIESDFGRPAPRLILNAMLKTSEEQHRVYLSMRNDGRNGNEFLPVELADIRCFINGELAAEAVPEAQSREGWYGEAGGYVFSAKLRPGDLVKIQASKHEKTVYSEFVVPQPVQVELVDTSSVKMDDYAYNIDRAMNVALIIKDIAGVDSWFRAEKSYQAFKQQLYYKNEDGELVGSDVPETLIVDTEVGIGSDPILNDGHIPAEEVLDEDNAFGDLFSFLYSSNKFKVFTDTRFKDSQAKVSVSVPFTSRLRHYSGSSQAWPSEADVSPTLRVCFQSLTKETYEYLKALNSGNLFGYDVNPLSEPVIIPSNVVGGLGFIGMFTDSYLDIDLPGYRVEFDSRYYDF